MHKIIHIRPGTDPNEKQAPIGTIAFEFVQDICYVGVSCLNSKADKWNSKRASEISVGRLQSRIRGRVPKNTFAFGDCVPSNVDVLKRLAAEMSYEYDETTKLTKRFKNAIRETAERFEEIQAIHTMRRAVAVTE